MNSRLLIAILGTAALVMPAVAQERHGDDDDQGWRGNRVSTQQAINVCRNAIREQAMERFGANQVYFRDMRMDNNEGRRDWVVGTVGMRNGRDRQQYPFSCSVNFDNGQVRSAQINAPSQGYAGRDISASAIDKCQNAVMDRLGGRVNFRGTNMDPDGDLVRGSAWSQGQSYDFSCRISRDDGDVRNLNVTPRDR